MRQISLKYVINYKHFGVKVLRQFLQYLNYLDVLELRLSKIFAQLQ